MYECMCVYVWKHLCFQDIKSVHVQVCVCMYVCLYVCMYVCECDFAYMQVLSATVARRSRIGSYSERKWIPWIHSPAVAADIRASSLSTRSPHLVAGWPANSRMSCPPPVSCWFMIVWYIARGKSDAGKRD